MFDSGFVSFKLYYSDTTDLAIGDVVRSEVISAGGHSRRVNCYLREYFEDDNGELVGAVNDSRSGIRTRPNREASGFGARPWMAHIAGSSPAPTPPLQHVARLANVHVAASCSMHEEDRDVGGSSRGTCDAPWSRRREFQAVAMLHLLRD